MEPFCKFKPRKFVWHDSDTDVLERVNWLIEELAGDWTAQCKLPMDFVLAAIAARDEIIKLRAQLNAP